MASTSLEIINAELERQARERQLNKEREHKIFMSTEGQAYDYEKLLKQQKHQLERDSLRAVDRIKEYGIQDSLRNVSEDIRNQRDVLNRRYDKADILYQQKLSEYNKLKTELTSKYGKLKDYNISGNFDKIMDTYAESDDIKGLRKAMGMLDAEYQDLVALSGQIRNQHLYFATASKDPNIVGLTGELDPHEYQDILSAYEAEYPGIPTVGLDEAYALGLKSAKERLQAATTAKAHPIGLASIDWADIREAVSKDSGFNISEYIEDDVLASHAMNILNTSSVESAIKILDREPSGKLKEAIMNIEPIKSKFINILDNLEKVDKIQAEYYGAYDEEGQYNEAINSFDRELANITTPEGGFKLYDMYAGKMSNNKQRKELFSKIESHFNVPNLYPAYASRGKEEEVTTSIRGLTEDILDKYKDDDGEVSASRVYEALDKFSPVYADKFEDEAWWMSDPKVFTWGSTLLHGEKATRDKWSPAKAFGGDSFGGVIDTDSPYYDTFHNEMQNSFRKLLAEEDPYGPNKMYELFLTGEETHVPKVIKERYGEEAYERAFKLADEKAKKVQLDEFKSILKNKDSDEYFKLIKALKLAEDYSYKKYYNR
tara:strand:+ start:1904 stop:3706 length:1803 start_codon:yes stop_codon:yes gene_type:complete